MKKNIATSLGFLISPLFAAVALTVIEVAKGRYGLTEKWTPLLVLAFYFYTLGVALIIGLPVYLFLKRFDKVTWWSAVLTGLLGGVVMVFVFGSLDLVVIPLGGLSGLIFWTIWRCGNAAESR